MPIVPVVRYNYPFGNIVDINNTNDNILTFVYDDDAGTEMPVNKVQVSLLMPYESGVGVVSPYVQISIYNNTPIMVGVANVAVALGVSTAQELADLLAGWLASFAVGSVTQETSGTQVEGQLTWWTGTAQELSKGNPSIGVSDPESAGFPTQIDATTINVGEYYKHDNQFFADQDVGNANLKVGYGTTAPETEGTAIGINATSEHGSTAIGAGASANVEFSTAIGAGATASGSGAIALGQGANAASNTFAIPDGVENIKWRGVTYTLPDALPAADAYLKCDSSGVLTWDLI